MKLEVKVIAASFDYISKGFRFLFVDGELPSIELTKCDKDWSPSKVVSEYLGVDSEWLDFTIVDIEYAFQYCCIYYVTLIPDMIDLLGEHSEWIDMSEVMRGNINDKDVEKVILSTQKV